MKRFNLRGQSANWGALKVNALNTNTNELENRSEIPYGHKVTVRVVDNYYRVYDRNVRQILYGEISDADYAEIIGRLSGKHRPDFILFHEGKVIGTANIHRRGWYRRMQERPKPQDFEFNVTLRANVKVNALTFEDATRQIYEAVENANKVCDDGNNLEIVSIEKL